MRDTGYRERWRKQLGFMLSSRETDAQGRSEGGSSFLGPKEFLGALANWAGKGRDELLQVICREIGQATASVLKEPLTELMRHRKLQITIELLHPDEPKQKYRIQAEKDLESDQKSEAETESEAEVKGGPRPRRARTRSKAPSRTKPRPPSNSETSCQLEA